MFSVDTPVSSTNKTDHHDIAEILLKVALNTIDLTPDPFNVVIIIRLFEKVMRAFTEAVQNLIDRYQIA